MVFFGQQVVAWGQVKNLVPPDSAFSQADLMNPTPLNAIQAQGELGCPTVITYR